MNSFSGLAEGDHIINIGTQNVQQIGSFDEIADLIRRTIETTSQVTLITLTSLAYQVLKPYDNSLEIELFDYQVSFIPELIPRLYQMVLQ